MIILLIAAGLRFYGQNWDQGHYFHPDERFVATVVQNRLWVPDLSELHLLLDPERSPLNTRSDGPDGEPRDFAYGSLPFLVAAFLGELLSGFVGVDLTSFEHIDRFGRTLTAIVDLGTVLLVVLFARRAFGHLASVIAGALTATAVILIQLAHFFTVDTWVTFFTTAALYASLRVSESFSLRWSLAAGALGGAALASKVSVGVLAIPIVVGMVIGVSARSATNLDRAWLVLKRLTVMAVPTVVVFAIFEPYALWRPGVFIDDIRTQWEIVNGLYDVPFTRQFVGTAAGLNEIENLVLWGVAPGFGLAALAAIAVGLYWAVTSRDKRYILLLSWILPYFYVIASSEARFLRYAAPLVPVLAIMVGHQLEYLRTRWRAVPIKRYFSAALVVGVIGVTLLWSLAFANIYSGTHPRVEASRWIYENVPAGSTITSELWDDSLPVQTDDAPPGTTYERLALDLYGDRPNEQVVDYIAGFLDQADYIVLSSQRLSHSIPRLPWRYPVQSAYYRLLEEEKLGFELVHTSTNYPGFGSWRINTLGADESFSVYDHPPVRIYAKVEELSRQEIDLRFAHAEALPRTPSRQPPESRLLLNRPVDELPAANDVGWSSEVTRSAPVAIAIWLLITFAFGVAALPLAVRIFPTFVDAGVGFAYLLGLLGVGLLVWLSWSIGIAPYTVGTIIAAFIVFAGISWWTFGFDIDWKQRFSVAWPVIVVGQGVFLATFGFFVLLRAMNPDLWHQYFGGERPMEIAYMNAIARSEEFPPYDPWYADGHLNYYYYGFFLITILWKVTGIPPEIAFQLSLATIAGLLAIGAYTLATTLGRSALQTRRRGILVGSGLTAVLLTLFVGNLDALRQIAKTETLTVDFWASSRVVEYGINEFPYFSFLYGDLHPHILAAPVLILIVSLGYSWIQNNARARWTWVILWALVSATAIGSITIINFWDAPTAAIITIASVVFPLIRARAGAWRDVIIAMGLLLAIGAWSWLLFLPFHERFLAPTEGIRLTSWGTGVSAWSTHYGIFAAVLVVVVLLGLQRISNKCPITPGYAAIAGATALGSMAIATIAGVGTTSDFLTVGMAALGVAVAGMLIGIGGRLVRDERQRQIAMFAVTPFLIGGGALALIRPVAAIASFAVAGFVLLGLSGLRRDAYTMLGIMGAVAFGLILTADVVYVADHLRDSVWERMNTVFKLYFQTWSLLAVVASLAVLKIVHVTLGATRRRDTQLGAINTSDLSQPRTWGFQQFSLAAVAVIVVLGLAYPAFATTNRLQHRSGPNTESLSLDGYAWMQDAQVVNQAGQTVRFSGDYEAVHWLRANAEGNQVILEASIGPYLGGGSRISSATGLPTVLGWNSHQRQQRPSGAIDQRSAEVRELYRTDDLERKRFLLRKYNVSYVIVGDVERFSVLGQATQGTEPTFYSTPEGIDAFDEMVGDELAVAFESGSTTVYRVLPFPRAGEAP